MEQKIFLITQPSVWRVPKWFLFAGLLAGLLLSRGAAQSLNEAEASKKGNQAVAAGQKTSQNDHTVPRDVPVAEPPPVSPVDFFLSLDGAPVMGNANASVAIVEFGDHQCPYCLAHANKTLPQIVTDYVKTGKVRYFYKDFPNEAAHTLAFKWAEAARCAGEQEKYWEMHDHLLKNAHPEVLNQLSKYSSNLGLDVPKLQWCLDNGTYAAQVQRDIQDARKYSVRGTPTFFVGTLDAQGLRMKAVTMVYGAWPYPTFQKALDQILSPEAAKGERQ